MDLLVQLGLLTDMQFSCPTGMTGSFARGVVGNQKLYMFIFIQYLSSMSACFEEDTQA